MKLGFIGLGNLGRALAERLIAQGYELVVWNRTASKAEGLNAAVASSPAAVAQEADIILLNLFDTAAVGEVLEGDKGLCTVALAGKIIIDTSTNHFHDVLGNYRSVERAGGAYIESPVLGSVIPAQKGELSVVSSGSSDAYEIAKEVIKAYAKTLHYVEKPALASKMKLINNMLLGSFMSSIAESVALSEKCGMQRKEAIDILTTGAGNCGVFHAKKEKLKNSDYSPHFSNRAIYKDLHYLQDMAYSLESPLFAGSYAKELFAETIEQGRGDEDFCSVINSFMKKN